MRIVEKCRLCTHYKILKVCTQNYIAALVIHMQCEKMIYVHKDGVVELIDVNKPKRHKLAFRWNLKQNSFQIISGAVSRIF